MEFRDVVLSRRSIRKYENKPISDEDLQDIIEAGLYAPSGVDFQPWYLVVIKSEEELTKVRAIMKEASDNLQDNLRTRFAKHPEVAEESLNFISVLGGAPVVILAFRHKKEYTKSDSTIVQSIGAALENIMLAAVDKGLGGCWLTAPIEGGKAEVLHDLYAPENGEMVALLTLGYPAVNPKAPRRKEGRYVII
jgi:nitroreductase